MSMQHVGLALLIVLALVMLGDLVITQRRLDDARGRLDDATLELALQRGVVEAGRKAFDVVSVAYQRAAARNAKLDAEVARLLRHQAQTQEYALLANAALSRIRDLATLATEQLNSQRRRSHAKLTVGSIAKEADAALPRVTVNEVGASAPDAEGTTTIEAPADGAAAA